ncbi:MATE family efflux transporter [Desulfosporosinus nitroreducens]|uniref:Probable multidrug resistance protein NorM n=1 Tax=Desulfosporosinus nitroreducens TaxID=2018668 RepID=A0ABT8QT73_9FIRM|nr:MATE family efflux transporter [Desulfosporosinus nitroreducens]MDO0824561.1 MATE family efflux transporter [Desulfosporosinus nitroreducens]
MKQTFSLLQRIRQLFAILWPILVAQVTMFSMSFFDTVMSGQASTPDLAGVAIGSSVWVPIGAGIGGIFVAVTPIVAQLIGARHKKDIAFQVMQGIYLALLISILVIAGGAFALDPILSLMGLEDNVLRISRSYLLALACGIPALFVYQVLRAFIDALGKTRVTMMIAVLSLPINVSLNYVLIFGKIGFPALGGVGAGVASALTYWFMLLITLTIILRQESFTPYQVFRHWYCISLKEWKEQLKIGLPIGFAIFVETSIFAVVALLMSTFNTVTIAAHQVAMNFATLLYMVPLSISSALTIVVGFEVGAKRHRDARQYSYLGMGMSIGMACICASVLLLFSEQVASLYSREVAVIQMAQHFLIFALFFQLSDAIAAPIQGALRGYKDVNVTFLMACISYWVIGLPSGYYMASYTTLGATGYWIGLVLGLAVSAIGLLGRLLVVQSRHKTLEAASSEKKRI